MVCDMNVALYVTQGRLQVNQCRHRFLWKITRFTKKFIRSEKNH